MRDTSAQAMYQRDHRLAWCKGGRFLLGKHQGKPVHGPVTYYVTHSWHCDFRLLVRGLSSLPICSSCTLNRGPGGQMV